MLSWSVANSIAIKTPFDQDLARLSQKLDETLLYYGSKNEKQAMRAKEDATSLLNQTASIASLARRSAFNASDAGKKNKLGEQELIDSVSSGRITLDEIEDEALPESFQSMAPAVRQNKLFEIASMRKDLELKIQALAEKRDEYLKEAVEANSDLESTLDHQVFKAVKSQAAKAGLTYDSGPKY